MTVKWTEGFEAHGTQGYLERKYAAVIGAVSTSSPGRLHGFFGNFGGQLVTPSLGVQDTWTMGFALLLNNANTGATFIVMSGASEQFRVVTSPSGSGFVWKIKRGSTVLETTVTVHALSVWHYFEVQVTVDPSAGAYEIRHNEQTLTSDTGVNTANTGAAGADVFSMRTEVTGLFDDVYICDDQGGVNDTFLGDQMVSVILPSADGASSEWTPSGGGTHASLVDDSRTSPNDADYVSSDTNGQKDLWEYQDDGLVTGEIAAIQVWTAGRMETTGTRTIRSKFRASGGAEANGPSHVVQSEITREFGAVYENNPDTGLPWTLSELNSSQFGVEVVS